MTAYPNQGTSRPWFGNYRLIRLLGKGGFAKVYYGEHIRHGTQGAIKVPYPLTKNNLERFYKEMAIHSPLKHRHIVPVLDGGEEDGIPFLVLTYASNGSLGQYYGDGQGFPLGDILPHVRQIADALQSIHNNGLIHRDIKPANILLGPNNIAWVSDFGIALTAHDRSFQGTQDGWGTPGYMAPEQIRGNPCFASDQYALAIIVCELLIGDSLFYGSATEVREQHLHTGPSCLCSRSPYISPALEQVLLKALEKDPRNRFASVSEFALALEQASNSWAAVPIRRRETEIPWQPVPVGQRVILHQQSAVRHSEPLVLRRRGMAEPEPLILVDRHRQEPLVRHRQGVELEPEPIILVDRQRYLA